MDILIDHGSAWNVGDISMLESAVNELLLLMPEATLHVVDRPRLRTHIWDYERVKKYPPYQLLEPLQLDGGGWLSKAVIKNVGRVGRHFIRSGTAKRGFALEFPNRIVPPATLRMKPAGTVADYCGPFDALFVAGGGMITDTFSWGLIQRSALVRTFATQGKPIVFTGQQIGPFASRHSRHLTAKTLRVATYVGVREPTASLDYARTLGARRYELMGDDSCGFSVDLKDATQRLKKRGLEAGQFFAVNVRVGDYAAEHATHLNRIAELVGMLTERTGLPALVVPVALGGQKSDILSGYSLRKAVGDHVLVLDDEDLTAKAVKGVMGLAHGAVGVSYHFCTFALTQGIPAVCIHDGAYYGQKGDGIAAFWGDSRLSLPLPGLDASAASELVDSVWKDASLRVALSKRSREAETHWKQVYANRVVPALQGIDVAATPSVARDEVVSKPRPTLPS